MIYGPPFSQCCPHLGVNDIHKARTCNIQCCSHIVFILFSFCFAWLPFLLEFCLESCFCRTPPTTLQSKTFQRVSLALGWSFDHPHDLKSSNPIHLLSGFGGCMLHTHASTLMGIPYPQNRPTTKQQQKLVDAPYLLCATNLW